MFGEPGISPPKPNPAVCVPHPAKKALIVVKPVGLDVQVAPLYSSVDPVKGGTSPPNAKAEVCVPAPPIAYLVVFKSHHCTKLVLRSRLFGLCMVSSLRILLWRLL
jgi:hypothetical protein